MKREGHLALYSHHLISFSDFFNLIPNPIAISTVDNGVYLFVNDAFTELTGYTTDEALGNTSIKLGLLNTCDRENVIKLLVEKGSIRGLEVHIVTKAKKRRTVIFSADYIDIQNNKYLLTSCIDVTELANLKEELNRLDRLNLIGEMAAGFAHEIRNPMTVIKGYLQLIMRKLPTDVKEQIAIALNELNNVDEIITSFLTLARQTPKSKESLNLNSTIDGVLPLIQADAIHHNIDVKVDYKPISYCEYDEKEITQVLLNICRNAIEAMHKHGTIKISTVNQPGYVRLIINDNGPGISKITIKKIFDPFYTTKESGTGLGLAICNRIIKNHSGKIMVKSKLGVGTSFIIDLPQHNERN